MRYRVIGTDAKSKKPIEIIIDAADDAAARADAGGRGVTVERISTAAEPVVVRIEPGHVQLIELTAKRWKGLLLASLAAMGLGLLVGGWFVLRDPRSLSHPPVMAWVGGVAAIIGLIGVVIARVGAWWGHG
jgi:hypothetical protein